jgi:hypothetical protein
MNSRRVSATRYFAALGMLVLASSFAPAQEQHRASEKYLCSEPHPEAICTSENRCGSASTPCTVEIRRTASDASATPSIPKAKANEPFCLKAGTTVNWKSASKNTGFVLDFGPDFPFGSEAVIGGSDRPTSTVANKKDCYKYSVGACASGSVYGMCGSAEAELVITGSE